jgi:hypothetical protein
VQESKDAKAKEKMRRETLCGRLDRAINHARAINTIYTYARWQGEKTWITQYWA